MCDVVEHVPVPIKHWLNKIDTWITDAHVSIQQQKFKGHTVGSRLLLMVLVHLGQWMAQKI